LICCKDRKSTTEKINGVHWEKGVPKEPNVRETEETSVVPKSGDAQLPTDDMASANKTLDYGTKVGVVEDSCNTTEAKDTFPVEFEFPSTSPVTEPIKIAVLKDNNSSGYGSLSRAISISYSRCSDRDKVRINVDEAIVKTLVSSVPRQHSVSISKRLTLSRISTSRRHRKKVRFNDKVVIHMIEYNEPKTVCANSDTYVLIITLREIWSKIDLDKDGFLNTAELKRFCLEVWEETNIDVPTVMSFYAKANPSKGMTFHEWCSLVKDEDEDVENFIDDLYYIFVEPISEVVDDRAY